MTCGKTIGTLWPKPRGTVEYETSLLPIEGNNIKFKIIPQYPKHIKIWNTSKSRFMKMLHKKLPDINITKTESHSLQIVIIIIDAENTEELPKLALNINESYKLMITNATGKIVLAKIEASNYYGARHGLETLAQLIVYNDITLELQILSRVSLSDEPAFKWRGLLLDTSRNFYSVNAIKRTLDAMAMVKLNTFHWHLIDSQSFSMEIKTRPELSKYGAYSLRKTYTHKDIAEIVEYARVRGIRIIPEFDAPAHVYEGWQSKNLTVCLKVNSMRDYCVEPPCGQLDPTANGIFIILRDIYKEMFDLFDIDLFHMGGSDVSTPCWKQSASINNWMNVKGWPLSEPYFTHLWANFQAQALQQIEYIAKQKNISIILWDSRLTEDPFIDEYLKKDRYFIQISDFTKKRKVTNILTRGYHIIVSNYESLLFGYSKANCINNKNCPYINWKNVYENKIDYVVSSYLSQVLGAEAIVWSWQVDEHNLDQCLWPKASALAEVLWTESEDNFYDVESRMLTHREYLVANGIGGESLGPEWCLQNEDECVFSRMGRANCGKERAKLV
uniref:Beta-hexosaminidase n=1 Tax=Glossina morsitans morsitans TaxID=37546 RepID=A0A1B0FQE2_GLOMM